MPTPHLTLDILSGPLDGHLIVLEDETEWCTTGTGALSFPWDNGLGTPQARIFPKDDQWYIAGYAGKRRTHHQRDGTDTIVTHEPLPLAPGDILHASVTWLQVNQERNQK